MNSTHVAALGGGALAYEKLTGLLTGWHGLTPDKADDAAWLIIAALTGLYMLAAWLWSVKYPKAPPLPPLAVEHADKVVVTPSPVAPAEPIHVA